MKNEREKKMMFKRFKMDPKTSKPGDLMKKANQMKKEGKKFPKAYKKHKKTDYMGQEGATPSGRMQGALGNFGRASLGNNGVIGRNVNSTMPTAKQKKHMKHKTHKKGEPFAPMNKVGKPSLKEINDGGENSKALGKQAQNFTKSKEMKTMCKMCEKKHEKGKHMKKEMHKEHKKNWIAGAIGKPGALHRELGVKQGTKIPASKLRAASKKGGKEGKRARLAQTLRGFHKTKKK